VALILTLAQSIPASEAKVAQERLTTVELGGRAIMATIAMSMVYSLLRRVLRRFWESRGYEGYGSCGR
jgi:hypothetical protein